MQGLTTEKGAESPVCSHGVDLAIDRAYVPLVVDLDGTLLRTDLLHESALRLIKAKPWAVFLLLSWWLRGRAYLKARVFEETCLDYASLPLHEGVVEWLREEKALGRHLVLATASDRRAAEQAVAHLDLFDIVLGSDPKCNLRGSEKIRSILHYCGPTFDYAGNSRHDQPVWSASREAILVNTSRSVEATVRRSANVTQLFEPAARSDAKATIRSLRPLQWIKNLLVYVPAFTSHTGVHWPILLKSTIAFLAFSMCASATYIANDLFDLEEDRRHLAKRGRPFASGECSILTGVVTGAACFLAGLGLASMVSGSLLGLLLLYICSTSCYSLYLKRVCLLDVLTLAFLYTIRIIAGHVVTGIPFSVWLLSFAFFLFISLAFSKRASELIRLSRQQGETVPPGRGYLTDDLPVITVAGVTSGFLSSLVFALYITSANVTLLYRRPIVLWAILPLLLYYIGRVWIVCGRGQLNDDPILYTAKSPSTYYVAAVVLIIMMAATIGF